jgi:UDP-glucose 4-epimerase
MSVDELAGRRVLVTGGTGFIGSHLCSRLRELGVEVYATSRGRVESGAVDVRWLTGDLADISDVRAALAAARPEIVFHLAGHVSGGREVDRVLPTFRDGLTSTVNLLSAAKGEQSPLIVLAGSMEEPAIGSAEPPSSPYAVAKWAASGYARMFHSLYSMPVVTLRIFMVYGPGQRDATKLVPYVMRSVLRRESPQLASGMRAVDWIYVEDVVDAFVAAAVAAPFGGDALDVGSGTTVTIRELVERIIAMVHPEIEPVFGALPDRPLETSNVADVGRTEKLLGWRPKTTLNRGLQATLDWFASEGGVELGGSSA